MAYKIEWTVDAQKDLKKLSPDIAKRIVRKAETLAVNPTPSSVETVKGTPGGFRIRMGDYRILYTIDHRVVTVSVIRVGPRGSVYR